MGIVVFSAIALYLIILISGVFFAARAAKRNGRNPWVWGAVAGLAIYLPVFWDHIPTLLAHKYYCDTTAGFRIYKTVERWKVENPGAAESLTWRSIPAAGDLARLPDGSQQLRLNERFVLLKTYMRTRFLSTTAVEESFVDVNSGEALAKRISIGSGYGDPLAGGKGWQTFKIWLNLQPCVPEIKAYGDFLRAVHQMGAKQ